MKQLIIADCAIKLQLNGSSLYVIFDGSEEQQQAAFITLWNANAYSCDTANDMGAYSYTVTTEDRFQKALFTLATLRILSGKGDYIRMRGKLWQQAVDAARAMWESAERVHWISAQAVVCDCLGMGSPSGKWDGDDN